MEIFNGYNQYFKIDRTRKKAPSLFKLFIILLVVYFVGSLFGSSLITNVYLLLKYPEIQQITLDQLSNAISIPEYTKLIQEYIEKVPVYINLLSYIAVLASIAIFIYVFEKRNIFSLGLKDKKGLPKVALGLVFGCITSLCLVLLLKIRSINITNNSNKLDLPILILTVVGWAIFALADELLFRGWLLQNIGEQYGAKFGIVITSLFAMTLNIAINGVSVVSLLNGFLYAMILNMVALRTGSVYCSWGIATAFKALPSVLLGIKSNGMGNAMSLFEIEFLGKDIITGGNLGIDFGLIMTLFLVIALGAYVLILYETTRRKVAQW